MNVKISQYHLGFVGFGHIAQILFRAIDRAKLIPRSQVSFVRRDRDKIRECEKEFGITSTSLDHLVKTSQILLIAVRPNQVDFVLRDLAQLQLDETKMVIAIPAGIHLAYYQKYLGPKVPLLRAMPNVASAVGEGMTVFSYGPHPSLEFRSLTNLLFSCMGEVLEVAEPLMDISCAIAGSGPALVFRLIEAVARFGEKEGLTYAKALKMAAQTFAGASKLLLKGNHPEALLDQIATPGGTTEAGLKTFNALRIEEHLQSAIESSAKRSKELSQEYY